MRIRAGVVVALTAGAWLSAPFATADAVPVPPAVLTYSAAHVVHGNNQAGVFVMPADGSAAGHLVSDPDVLASEVSSVTPDGTRVAYMELLEFFRSRIRVVPSDGSAAPVFASPVNEPSGRDEWNPVWTRDGTRLAYLVHEPATRLVTVTTPGGAETSTPLPAGVERFAFSPSGRQLVAQIGYEVGSHLELITVASGTRTRLAGGEGGSYPSWSPDGRTIVFSKYLPEPYSRGLFRVAAGGGVAQPLRTVAGHFTQSSAFSRDGRTLYWFEGAAAPYRLWTGRPDGSDARVLDNGPADPTGYLSAGGGPAPATDTAAPAAPAIRALGSVTGTSATIWWDAPADATEFLVLRKPHGAPAPSSPADGTFVYGGGNRSATAGGLTTGTAYDLYVFGYDAWGNASAPSAAHPVRPANAAPPVAAQIGLVSHGAPGTAFPVRWSGGHAPYVVEVGEKLHTATTWSGNIDYRTLAATPATALTFTGTQGHRYFFRVRGTDGFGNRAAASGAVVANVPYDDTNARIRYSAWWRPTSSPGRFLGTSHLTATPGATATFTDLMSGFLVVGDRCAGCGVVRVYYDGVLRATVDTGTPATLVRQVLYSLPPAASVGRHTVRLVALGTAGRPQVRLDGIALVR